VIIFLVILAFLFFSNKKFKKDTVNQKKLEDYIIAGNKNLAGLAITVEKYFTNVYLYKAL